MIGGVRTVSVKGKTGSGNPRPSLQWSSRAKELPMSRGLVVRGKRVAEEKARQGLRAGSGVDHRAASSVRVTRSRRHPGRVRSKTKPAGVGWDLGPSQAHLVGIRWKGVLALATVNQVG